ncbi:hypothetical protein ACG3SL_06800 [Sphingomonas sp. CJ20]
MRFATTICGALALSVVVLPIASANAQEVPPAQDVAASPREPQDDILVTGQRGVERKVAQRYVRQISSSFDGQLSRFTAPVCPAVMGLPDSYGEKVVVRIRDVARQAKISVAEPGCSPNLILILAADADAMVKAMRIKYPRMFAKLADAELQRALRDGPVHVWNTVEVQNEDGRTQGKPESGDGIAGGAPILSVTRATFLELPTQQVTLGSVVVIDDDAAMGKTLWQLADYAAMRALAGARPPSQGVAADTILTLFDSAGAAPRAMTALDQSYLAGLYDTRGFARSTTAMGLISAKIVNDAKAKAEGAPTGKN